MQIQYLSFTSGAGGRSQELTPSGNSLTTEQVPTEPYNQPSAYVQEGVSAIAGLFLLAGVLFMLRRASSHGKAQHRSATGELEGRNAIPCQNCHYFNPNTFLPCAVNPAMALRKEAVDCSDYCPRHAESVSRSVHS
ncbi:MAG: hypothetical protein ICV62_16900 [Cyanobacteria bacterium Co-bin13]|nr:hypothetical protein [Cyanobacteria bacterium Co-bin13]